MELDDCETTTVLDEELTEALDRLVEETLAVEVDEEEEVLLDEPDCTTVEVELLELALDEVEDDVLAEDVEEVEDVE